MSQADATILITGGAGFIGSTLVRQCLKEDAARVVNLDCFTYAGHRASLDAVENHPSYTLAEGDIGDAQWVGEILSQHQPQAIMHLAAESHVDRSIVDPHRFVATNVLGTCTLLEEATRYWLSLEENRQSRFRFLYVSTDEVFGATDEGEFFDESSPVAPNSPYAASKSAGEQLTQSFGHTYGLPFVIANPTNHYGPRQHPEKLIPRMILNAAADEILPIYGDGLQQRDWIHVEDGCRALRTILASGKIGTRYLVGSETSQPNLSVVESICDLVDEVIGDSGARRQLIQHVADRLGHDRRYAISSKTLRTETTWRPRVDFTVGLRNTVTWYLENPDWVAAISATS